MTVLVLPQPPRRRGQDGCAYKDRLGPYDTEAEAARALEKVKERNEEWDNDPAGTTARGLSVAIPQGHKASPWPFIAMMGMAGCFFLYAASGLLAPWYGVVLLLLIWVVLFVVATRWWTPHPKRTAAAAPDRRCRVVRGAHGAVRCSSTGRRERYFGLTRRITSLPPPLSVVTSRSPFGGAGDLPEPAVLPQRPRRPHLLQLARLVEGQEQDPAGLEAGHRERAVEGAPLVAVHEPAAGRREGRVARAPAGLELLAGQGLVGHRDRLVVAGHRVPAVVAAVARAG